MPDPAPRLAIRPPEYLPRSSFLALVDYVDVFVVADTFELSRQSYQNRSPIRTPDGRMWMTLPLERESRGRSIDDVKLAQRRFWPGKHWRALVFNYSSAPFFEHFAQDLEGLLRHPWERLGDIAVESLHALMRWFGIETEVRRLSDTGGGRRLADAVDLPAGHRIVASAETADYDAKWMTVGEVLDWADAPYAQNFEGYEADLSALDLLFNWGPEALGMLRERRRIVREVKRL